MRKKKDLHTKNLFEKESNLKIIRLTRDDILCRHENVKVLSSLIKQHETMYPEIEKWLKSKVLPGIKQKNRIAYMGLDNEKPVVSAVLKLGEHAKICHLHIDDENRDQRIGDLFFSMMALDAKREAKEIHFTLPESLWLRKEAFFKSFGFGRALKALTQYRKPEDELRCSASFDVVWRNALNKLPLIVNSLSKSTDNIFSGILMSIKPEHVAKIFSGDKVVEIRRKFNRKWVGCRTTIYSSSPDKAIYGHAKIDRVKKDSPERIWSEYGQLIGVDRRLFDKYTDSSGEIYAIFLENFEPYRNPVYLSQIEGLLNFEELTPPQSYLSLENNSSWSKAVSVAELLHNRFWIHQIMSETHAEYPID